MSEQVQQPIFGIEKIYVKDLSLEVPGATMVYLDGNVPEIQIQIGHAVQPMEGALFEVSLRVTVAGMVGDKAHFMVEVSQAGIFQATNVAEEDMGTLYGIVCPNVLFPYARETVSDLVTRAGFPPVLLSPINFELLHQQRLAEAEQEASRIQVAL